jgi:hypothetical protein
MKKTKVFNCTFLLLTLCSVSIYLIFPIPVTFISIGITFLLILIFSILLSVYITFHLKGITSNKGSRRAIQTRRPSYISTSNNRVREASRTTRSDPVSRPSRRSPSFEEEFWDKEITPSTRPYRRLPSRLSSSGDEEDNIPLPPPRRSSRLPSFGDEELFDDVGFVDNIPLPPPRRSSRLPLFDDEELIDDEVFKERTSLPTTPRRPLRRTSSIYDEIPVEDIAIPPSSLSFRPKLRPSRIPPSTNKDRSVLRHRPVSRLSPDSAQPVLLQKDIRQNVEISTPIPGIFISHSSKDDIFGSKLVNDLQNVLGKNNTSWYDSKGDLQRGNPLWYDSRGGLQGGDNWWDKVMEELKARPIFIVILSSNAMSSGWVKDEINVAWRHKNSLLGKRIIPILYKPCEAPDYLHTIQNISFEAEQQYDLSLQKLLQTLDLPTKK